MEEPAMGSEELKNYLQEKKNAAAQAERRRQETKQASEQAGFQPTGRRAPQ
jgi:hypothetical protein